MSDVRGPGPDFSLSPSRHQQVAARYDPGSVVRLLNLLPPDARDEVLAALLGETPGKFPAYFRDSRTQQTFEAVMGSRQIMPMMRDRLDRIEFEREYRKNPVFIAVVPDSMVQGSSALLMRRKDGADYILLGEYDTRWDLLALALEGLMNSRKHHGIYPGRTIHIRITATGDSPGRYSRARGFLAAQLSTISSAPVKEIPGVGSYPALRFYP